MFCFEQVSFCVCCYVRFALLVVFVLFAVFAFVLFAMCV